MCRRKVWPLMLKRWASLKEMAFVESLWLHTFSLNAFSFYFQLISLLFSLLLSLSSILFFPDFFPFISRSLFSFSCLSVCLLLLYLHGLPYVFFIFLPSSFSCLHLRSSCEARGILFSSLWIWPSGDWLYEYPYINLKQYVILVNWIFFRHLKLFIRPQTVGSTL